MKRLIVAHPSVSVGELRNRYQRVSSPVARAVASTRRESGCRGYMTFPLDCRGRQGSLLLNTYRLSLRRSLRDCGNPRVPMACHTRQAWLAMTIGGVHGRCHLTSGWSSSRNDCPKVTDDWYHLLVKRVQRRPIRRAIRILTGASTETSPGDEAALNVEPFGLVAPRAARQARQGFNAFGRSSDFLPPFANLRFFPSRRASGGHHVAAPASRC